MKSNNWFTNKLETLKDDLEFRLETLILDITENICWIMKEKNISRKGLAAQLQVSPPAVTKILNGNSNFTLKTLLSLSDALDHELTVNFTPRDLAKYNPIMDFTMGFSATGNIEDPCLLNVISLKRFAPHVTKTEFIEDANQATCDELAIDFSYQPGKPIERLMSA